MLRRILLTGGLIIFLTACIPATSTLIPTLVQSAATATVTASAAPTASPELSLSTDTPEAASATMAESSPTPQLNATDGALPVPALELEETPDATANPQPAADSGIIQILNPGPFSKLVSPFRVHGYAVPGHDHKGLLELYGEDGRVLGSQLIQLNTPYKWAFFFWEFNFKTSSVGELGRLSLSTQDEYGRINAVNSVHLLLLSQGMSILNPPGNLQERCVIASPAAGERLSGGVLAVSGKMRPYNSLPLTVELVSRDGVSLATQVVPIVPAADDGYVPFRVDIDYSIPNGQYALLVVRQFDDRISGIMYLYSQELFLNP